ncbi:MAG: rhodanese family protein [Hyphomonadaceae bacterium]|nr:rhodanese family protein [Hyphomonadaceae bacterium]
MTTLTPIDPAALSRRLKAGDIRLIDIREADEFAREHVADAISIPLSNLEAAHLNLRAGMPVAFTCRTGMRTGANCDRLAAYVSEPAYVLEGGLDGWKKAGLAVTENRKAPLEIMRQVQIAAGSLVVVGAMLAIAVNPAFAWLSAIIGAGLVFAGASGWCGLAKLLSLAPWNRRAA